MNKQELIKQFEDMPYVSISQMGKKSFVDLIEQLDEPEPIKLRDVIARIKQLDIGTRKVWLDEFLNELGSDYGTMKYKDGYEQGKLEGAMEREKVIVPQFVADWIERIKKELSLREAMSQGYAPHEVDSWLREMDQDGACLNQDLFARAWLDGYDVEKEKRYRVKVKGKIEENVLTYGNNIFRYFFTRVSTSEAVRISHTRKELEDAGFGWVFDCSGIEIEEVEE